MHQHTQIYSIYLYLNTPVEAELLFPKGSRFHKQGQQQQEKKTHSTCVLKQNSWYVTLSDLHTKKRVED